MIKFQDHLIEIINKSSFNDFPNPLLIIGEKGSGKKSLLSYIKDQLAIEIVDITSDLSVIYNLTNNPFNYLCSINMDNISIKDQNSLLKTLEEPPQNIKFVLTSTRKEYIIPTVYNRCIIWELKYTKDQLNQFIPEGCDDVNLVLNIANTPGEIEDILTSNYMDMKSLAEKMISSMHIASFPNTLSIASKIGFKGEKEKFNPDIFTKIYIYIIAQNIQIENSPTLNKLFNYVVELNSKFNIKNINKEYLFEHYLTKIWLLYNSGD